MESFQNHIRTDAITPDAIIRKEAVQDSKFAYSVEKFMKYINNALYDSKIINMKNYYNKDDKLGVVIRLTGTYSNFGEELANLLILIYQNAGWSLVEIHEDDLDQTGDLIMVFYF